MSRLFIVPTPIGNLEDITHRALKILSAADLILAEDTRTTGILLKHYGIKPKKLLAYHQHNEHHITPAICKQISEGQTAALVSDAGTPVISDPGYLLVRECLRLNIPIEVLPGPTAFVPALILSGLPSDSFYFAGFLPHRKGRISRLEFLSQLPSTFVLYESPHRLIKTLQQLSEYCGETRRASISRELTKIYEETLRGTLKELLDAFTSRALKGEFIIVVEGRPQ